MNHISNVEVHLKTRSGNVNINTCKRMRQGPTIGGISSVQLRKVGRSLRLQMCLRRLLCVRIEIDQY